LQWAEHCVECAAPGCYQSCDLYQARPDIRCRRFTFGALKNRNFPSLRGYGVEISFKKWAKLHAYGNLALVPAKTALRNEALLEWLSPVGNSVGQLMERLTGKMRWRSATHIALESLVRRADKNKRPDTLPDAFLLEVYNPSSDPVRMQLSFSLVKDEHTDLNNLVQLAASFITTATFPPGYSRHEFPAARFHSVTASGRPFVIEMVPEADQNARLVFLTADFVKFAVRKVDATSRPPIKCVVWDLDNTLWQGILIEGDRVTLRPNVLALLTHLDERGILLSIASKNDHATAWAKLQELGISDYFLYPQINWAPKSHNIAAIAKRLNISADTFAFIDDNPFELDQVGQDIPDVTRVHADELASLFSDPRFQGSTSADSKTRRHFYQEAIAREIAQEEFGANYQGFLATCGITLEIAPYSEADSERVAELVQRTNQLNFSGHKYTRAQLEVILADAHLEKFVLRSSDKYGSYGTVGFSIVGRDSQLLQIHDFMLSCRVQGKYLEQAFFHHLLAHHNPEGASKLWVNFKATARNKPAHQVLESLGFRECDPASDRLIAGMLHSSPDDLRCDIIQVNCSNATLELARPALLTADHIKQGFA